MVKCGMETEGNLPLQMGVDFGMIISSEMRLVDAINTREGLTVRIVSKGQETV